MLEELLLSGRKFFAFRVALSRRKFFALRISSFWEEILCFNSFLWGGGGGNFFCFKNNFHEKGFKYQQNKCISATVTSYFYFKREVNLSAKCSVFCLQ